MDFVLQILQSFFGEIGDVRHGLGLIPVREVDGKGALPASAKKRKPEPNRAFFLRKDIKISREQLLRAFLRLEWSDQSDRQVNADAVVSVERIGRAVAVINTDDCTFAVRGNLQRKPCRWASECSSQPILRTNSIFPEVTSTKCKVVTEVYFQAPSKLIFGE